MREIHLDAGPHVKRFESDPVLLQQCGEERRGPILSNIGEKTTVTAAAEFEEKNHGDRGIGGTEVGDGLGRAVVEDAEIFLFKAGNDVAVLGGGDDVERDDGDVHGNGNTGVRRFL